MLLIEPVHGRQIVTGCCARSRRAGVSVGMSVSHARALLPTETIVQPHDAAADERTLHGLARWAMRFTPTTAADAPTGLLLDITGCERLFGGEPRLLRTLLGQLRELGLTAHAAIGPTVGSAWAVARFGGRSGRGGPIIEEADLPGVLEDLPVAALRIDEPTATTLADVGIERIGELLTIGREAVADRFGESLWLRVDQALGRAFEGVQPIRPRLPLQVSRSFQGPVKQLAGIEQTVHELVHLLCAELERRESGVRRLVLTAERIDANDLAETLTLSRPSRAPAHLWRLLRPRVERLHLGYGIERLTLHAAATARMTHQQMRQWHEHHHEADRTGSLAQADDAATHAQLAALVDQLRERLGEQNVRRMEPRQTYVPERAFATRPMSDAAHEHQSEAAAVLTVDRPTQLWNRPEAIEVVALSPDGPVASMRRHGRTRRILTSIGPERITPRWWLAPPATITPLPRDYFKVQDEHGTWWWLYRKAGTPRWFIHGTWT